MKKCLAIATVSALVLVAALVPSAPSASTPVIHSATGSGHQDDIDAATGEVFNRTFSFSAVQYADGTASGNAQIASRKFQLGNVDLVIHMRIDCLHVLPDGKTAQLSGVVTRTSFPFPDAPVGTFAATSEGADILQCRLDDALFSRCASDQSQQYEASQLSAGPHSFEVRAVERSVPGRAAIHTWLVRRPEPLAGPIVRIEAAPGITTSSFAQFTFSGAARYECRLDETGTFEECPPAFSDLNLGAHTLEVRGLETNGRRGSITTYPWTIVALPSVTITAAPEPRVFEDESVRFEFSSNDEGATFLCRFDSDDFVSCESGTT